MRTLTVLTALLVLALVCPASAEVVPIDNAQIAYLIAHGIGGMPESPPTEPSYNDVPVDSICFAEIEYVGVDLYVMPCYSEGPPGTNRFWPEQQPTRGTATLYVVRAIQFLNTGDPNVEPDFTPPATPSFSDVPPDFIWYTHIEYLVSLDILHIVHPDRTFRPDDPMDLFVMADWLAAGGLAYVDPLTVPYRTGTIAGIVSDSASDLGLTAASIECAALASETGSMLPATTTTSAADGIYLVEVRAMTHPLVTATLSGYYPSTQTDVVVLEGRTIEVPFSLNEEFGDVGAGSWAYEDVAACVEAGIVSGYEDGFYQPDWSVSRDAMAVFISRALAGSDDNVPAGPIKATFDDVAPEHWAYKYVEYCVAEEIVQGYDSVTYAPTVTVSRDAMAVFISRADAGGDDSVPVGPAEATFEDVPTDHWAYRYVEYCTAACIVQGYDPVTYAPTAIVTRDQMAVFICRAFDL